MRFAMSSSSSFPLPISTSTRSRTHHKTNLTLSLIQHNSPNSQETHQIDENSLLKPKTIRFRLSHLCKQGNIHLARQLFDAIPQPTTVLWNALIIGYICNNLPQEAISLYSHMSLHNQKCDAYTYSSVLKACAETKRISIGKVIHCHILRNNVYPSRIVYNSLLNMYATCLLNDESGFDSVSRVFRTMGKRNVVAWNTMISWYSKKGRFFEAVGHFVMMVRMGVNPTAVTFVNVFPAVSGLGDVEVANVVYGMVVKLGDEFVKDLFVVSSAITMYSELSCLDFARKIFDNCLEKNAHVWNTMIGGYVENNRPMMALELFCNALEERNGENIDDVTFLLALNAASQFQDSSIARQLHSLLIKISMNCYVTLLNAVVSLYSRCNLIYDSFKVFNGMAERDLVSWNTIISALVQNGLDSEGLMLVYEMQKQGLQIDDVAITALLSASSNLRNQEIGKQTHAYLIRHEINFNGMGSYLIDMYSKSGSIQKAETIFYGIYKYNSDQAIWNAMISGATQNGLIDKSFVIFRQMIVESVTPNAVTLASVLPACSQSGSIALGKQIHGFSIRNLLDENVFVGSALVDMYSKSGSISYAERVFLNTTDKNSVTYTNMILGYGQHGMGEKAISLFFSMRESGINPDPITFVAVLSACNYTGLVDEGLKIFDSMENEYSIRPSIEHYACVVDMLGRVGRVVEAYDFALKLGQKGNILGIWGSLLGACKIHRNFELGKIVADRVLEMEGSDRVAGYQVLLSNIYAEEENWESVKFVRKDMVERGLMKEVGCSWIDVSGYANCFVSKDKKHPRCGEIYRVLEELSDNMKDAEYAPTFSTVEI